MKADKRVDESYTPFTGRQDHLTASEAPEALLEPPLGPVVGSVFPAGSPAAHGSAKPRPDARVPSGKPPPPLLLHNLLNDLTALGPLLLSEARQGSWLNAYLVAAGMNQIVEDYLHPDPYFLGKASGHLARMRPSVGRPAAGIARFFAAGMSRHRSRRKPVPHLDNWQTDFATLVQRLAEVAIRPTAVTPVAGEKLLVSAEALVAALARFPHPLLREVLRLPSCFRSFDQQPADLDRIVQEFAQRWPDRRQPLLVAGVRSSGSYLAPLYGAFLKAHGYQDVQVLTLRPGRWLWRSARAVLQGTIQRRGLVLLVDDPPVSGGSLVEVAEILERAGVPTHRIIMLLQLFSSREGLPPRLHRYTSVLLPWDAWAIHAQLDPEAIQATLTELLAPDHAVSAVARLPLPPARWERGHAHALYEVHLVEQATGRRHEQAIYVKGAGLGYFGEHTLALGRALGPLVSEVYGVRAGLVYRAWLPEGQRLSPDESGRESERATAMIAYVEARHHALPIKDDVSLRLVGRLPVWEAGSNLLAQVFGRAWMLARLPIADPIVKRLLRSTEQSVIDGNMTASHWFIDGADQSRLIKVGFDERAFSNRDLYCYDPAFDVASLSANLDLASPAANGQPQRLSRLLRDASAHLSFGPISAERWLLYQLVHLSSLRHLQQDGERPDVRRALSRALQRYFTEIFFHDLSVPTAGALCALDIDGVLETGVLGFSGLTPASAATLRALTRHGYRPILATGRSLGEVRERCAAYHLAGGVAEYGSVVYNHSTGSARSLLSEADRHDLDQVRAVLSGLPGVLLDVDYNHTVRAYRLDAAGKRRGLRPEDADPALASAGMSGRVRAIAGHAQTDFMVAGIDKGTGLRVLAADLEADGQDRGGKPLTLAVGDTFSDLPMFDLAALAFAPASADAQVRNSGTMVLKRPYQAGLALAASKLLGHSPGGCPICRIARSSGDTRLLLAVLGARESGMRGLIRRTLPLIIRIWRDA
ncbi:MAG TPA: HAD hydrolase family protein [Chloroflexota bacterium]